MNRHISTFASSGFARRVWALAEPRRRPPRACLTDVLKQIPEFTQSLLPHSRRVVTAVNRSVEPHRIVPPSTTTKERNLYSVVGLSVDRGALFYSGADVMSAALIFLNRGRKDAKRIANALQEFEPPSKGGLRDMAFLGWLTVLGLLEPVRRGFRPLSDVNVSALPSRPTSAAVRVWLSRIVPPDVLNEVADLLRRVRDNRVSGPFTANPILGGIGPVTGSDGDWIAGNTLVELKCVVHGMQSIHVAQLICYYVFDQMRAHGHEPFGFTNLALCFPRQDMTVVGSIDEWLLAFGAPASDVVVPAVASWLDAT